MTQPLRLLILNLIVLVAAATAASAQSSVPRSPDADREAGGTERRATQPDGQPANDAKAAKPDPLDQLLKSANRATTLGRTQLRDSLYAFLATAEDEKTAKRIKGEIEKLYGQPGSDTVLLLVARATKVHGQKKPELAIRLLDAAIDLAPDFPEAYVRRSLVYHSRGDTRAALGDLRRVLALDPNHFKALLGVATLMRELGNERGALRAYERLKDVNPFSEEADKGIKALKDKVRGRGI